MERKLTKLQGITAFIYSQPNMVDQFFLSMFSFFYSITIL